MQPPYLELAYYVGDLALATAMAAIAPGIAVSSKGQRVLGAVGLAAEEEVAAINGSVVLRTEGEAFCGPLRRKTERLNRLGAVVSRRFVEVAQAIPCAYGAILVEYSLERPDSLERDPRSLAFRDFFLGSQFFSASAIREILEIAGTKAEVRAFSHGTYVFTSPEFRDAPGEQIQDMAERSAKISAVVGKRVLLR